MQPPKHRQDRKQFSYVVHEVGLRDGLQMEKQIVPTGQKIAWAEGLMAAGLDILQLGSFVHPDKVPQMADTDLLFNHFKKPGRKPERVILSGLALNEKGLERGEACGVEMYCLGVSASDTHSRKNTGMSSASSQRPEPLWPPVNGSKSRSSPRSAADSRGRSRRTASWGSFGDISMPG
jgi:hydroxymethylglutaryl-CoA lyase